MLFLFVLILYLLFLLYILQFFSDECCVSFFTFIPLRFVRLLESESWYLLWVLKIFQLFPFQILPSPLPSFGTLFVHVRCFHSILKVFSLFSIFLSLIILFWKFLYVSFPFHEFSFKLHRYVSFQLFLSRSFLCSLFKCAISS